ncbi:MAG TPA: response regulator [Rhizomicrobium sp.]|nr:response regulator [Rhizomicrobium sp.]
MNKTSTNAAPIAGTAPLICVVDDDRAVCDSLRLLLRRNGFEVETFSSPHDLLTSRRLDRFDCLIVDQKLPVMTGLELMEILRTRAYLKPAVLMWSAPEPHLSQRIQRAGILQILQKPVETSALLAALGSALRT